MGREIKRVAAGFDWPLGKVWGGYVNPWVKFSWACHVCGGDGCSPELRRLKNIWYGFEPFNPEDNGSKPLTPDHPAVRRFAERNLTLAADELDIAREASRLCELFNSGWSYHLNQDDVNALVKEGRLREFTHIFTPGVGWTRRSDNYIPTADEVNASSIEGVGHDSLNMHVVVEARAKRDGIKVAKCMHCGGTGSKWKNNAMRRNADRWKRNGPPKGSWWQVWETVSQGSPVTPAFESAEKLVNHLVMFGDDCYRKSGRRGWKREAAEAFVMRVGWIPSAIGVPGKGMLTGADAAEYLGVK